MNDTVVLKAYNEVNIMDGEGNGMSNQTGNELTANEMGTRMKELRKKRGWTQQHIAKKLDKKVTTYSGWENSNRLPPTEMVPEIARALECTIDYLYGRTTEPNKTLADEIMTLNEAEIKILRGMKFTQEELENLTEEQIREIRSFIEYQLTKIRNNPANVPNGGL